MPQDGGPFYPGDRSGSGDRSRPGPAGFGALPPELDPRGHRNGGRSGEVLSGARMGGRIAIALVSIAVLVGSGVAWARYRQFESDIQRVNAFPAAVPGKAGSTATPKKDIDGKDQNILITGNDDRSTATPNELAAIGTTEDGGSLNTDTMMLLHIPANGKKATAISFPRDTYVNIPGFGKDRLNAAYPDGYNSASSKVAGAQQSAGSALLVQTLEGLTGLTIDHYVQVDLIGFYRISNAIGGVTVCLNNAVQDSYSGIDLPAGTQTIEGKQALAFVRQRHGLDGGDLDRIKRQQYFLSAVFRKVTSAGTLLNPSKLSRLLSAVSSSLLIDGDSKGHTGLDPLKLAQQMQNLTTGNLTFTTIPVTPQTIDGKDVEVTDTNTLPAFVDSVIGTPQVTAYSKAKVVSPSTVTVSVLNGTGQANVATTNATVLKTVGFKASTGDTGATTATQIRYPAGMEAQAKTVAQYVPGVSVVTNSDVRTVTLVIGSDGKKAVAAKSTPTATTPTASSTVQRNAATVDCIN